MVGAAEWRVWGGDHQSLWLVPLSFRRLETPKTCLCRIILIVLYDIADIVRIVEFYNQWPVVSFLHRTGELLNIRGEKVPETVLYNTILKSVAEFPQEIKGLVDFTCCESVFLAIDGIQESGKQDNRAPHYILFLEINMVNPEDHTKNGLPLRLSLAVFQNPSYKFCTFRPILKLVSPVFIRRVAQCFDVLIFVGLFIVGGEEFVRKSRTV